MATLATPFAGSDSTGTPYGGLAIGEDYQPHLDPRIKDVQFDPKDRSTWGQGGKCSLLIYDCTRGSTHSTITGGSGFYKTSCLMASMYTWTGAACCLDPSSEIAKTVAPIRRAMGHELRVLSPKAPHLCSYNAIDWIDPRRPAAEGDVLNVIEWISGYTSRHDQTAQFFKDSGKTMLATFLADLLWANDIDPRHKTLRHLRAAISVSDEEIKKRLKLIAKTSKSDFAAEMAEDLCDTPDETFGGLRRNAMEDTKWLSIPAYAQLVSGDSFRTDDILDGHTDIFAQLPINTLNDSPGLGRTIIGSFLNAAFNVEGRIWGHDAQGRRVRSRIWFPIDEAWTLRNMSIISTALYAGRKSGITLQLYYPAQALMRQQWGHDGATAMEAVLSFRSVAAIKDADSAEKISKDIGERGYLVANESANTGWQGRWNLGSRSRGQSHSVHEIRRRFIPPEEILYRMRDDEQIVFNVYGYPLRCSRPIAWRRPEIAARLDVNPYLDDEDADEEEVG
jgi:type IV secretion system protein VirD4